MLILIAESKTMEKEEFEFSPGLSAVNRPEFEDKAAEIMRRIMEMPASEIASAMKVSDRMVATIKQMAYEFPVKDLGLRAIEAFTGVVFKHLDFAGLTTEAKERAEAHVRIISSIYGWLRPTDIIKPYRMEYGAKLAPRDTVLSTFWRSNVTVALVKTLQASGETEVLDLLPADAAKCVDWKLVKRFAKVRKVDFKEQTGETVRSPHAGRLKALRGELLRHILDSGISSVSMLSTFETDSFLPVAPQYPDHLAFMV